MTETYESGQSELNFSRLQAFGTVSKPPSWEDSRPRVLISL